MKIQKTWPLILASLLAAAPAAVQAQFTYQTNGAGTGTATLTHCANQAGALTISNFVTSIKQGAFINDTAVTGPITIPTSVTNIGNYAFQNCTSLTNVSIAGSVTIGDEAFQYCSNLITVTLGNATSLGAAVFYACSNLTTITLPSTLTTLSYSTAGDTWFDYCGNLTNIGVAAGNTKFSSSNGVLLTLPPTNLLEFPPGLGGSYTVLTNVTSISSYAFAYSALTNVTIPAGVTNISTNAFNNCFNLTRARFMGNAPVNDGQNDAFDGDTLAAYYVSGATGWSNTYAGMPCYSWTSTISGAGTNFPAKTNKFVFTITGPTNFSIVVQVCTNLANPQVWTPIKTNNLTNGTYIFSDPEQTDIYGRYYNVMTQ
jgi:hypothetical protein